MPLVLSRLQLRLLAAMTFSGWVATLAGWWVTEIGRQPFLVYGLLRTADLVAPHPPAMVLSTLVAYLVVYAGLLLAYVGVLMHMAQHPAKPTADAPLSPRPCPSADRHNASNEARDEPDLERIPAPDLHGVMGLALLAYVVLDGYDLGVGILLPFATEEQKDVMVSSIGPFWDANETWLVLASACC